MENVETQARARHTRQPTRETTGGNFWGSVNAVQRCTAPSWSADAGARGMSISSGSPASACGGVPSSSSSDSSAMAHTDGPSSAGSDSICFANKSPAACSSFGLCNGLAEFVVSVGPQGMPTSRPRLVFAAEVRGGARRPFGRRLSPPCYVHHQGTLRSVCRLHNSAASSHYSYYLESVCAALISA